MPYDFKLTTTIPAPAQEIYDAWLDSVSHSEMTRAEASMSNEIGAEVSAWDGYITGRNLELVSGERIVQSWRTTEFSDEHEDSIVTVMLEEVDGGTLLTLIHANVPDEQTSYEQGGWHEYYFEPMKEYFSSPERATVDARRSRLLPTLNGSVRHRVQNRNAGRRRQRRRSERKSRNLWSAQKPVRSTRSELNGSQAGLANAKSTLLLESLA